MYANCLFCHADLGRNEVIESFPVGRRLAFDSANGRFWVICPSCKRWNLSPLEERWDAMDTCERLYQGTRLRMSTDNIGLARVGEGTELVRVGKALRPEMAAWRFSAQLAARRRQYLWLVAGAGVAVGGLYAGIAAAGIGIGAFQGVWQLLHRGYERATRLVLPSAAEASADPNATGWRFALGRGRRPLSEAEIAKAAVVPRVETSHVRGAKLSLDPATEALEVKVPLVGHGLAAYRGDAAMSVLPKLIAKLNRFGGSKTDERLAVEQLATVANAGVDDLPRAVLAKYAGKMLRGEHRKDEGTLGALAAPTKLALEMALQEQRERELLAGELLDLEFAWREAEELARITDTLVPTQIEQALAKLKARLDR